ncbi:MAG: hypothetical protein ACTHM6_01765 [Tepidisphaeraceae bacterium]
MRRLMWCASALVLAAGCVPKTQVKPPYTGPTDSLAVVVGHLNDRNERIVSLRAEGDFSANLIDPQTKKATSGDGDLTLLYTPPANLRLVGKVLTQKVFDIGTNEDRFWVTLPQSDTMWWGEHASSSSASRRILPIRPDLLAQVIAITPLDHDLLKQPVPTLRFNNDQDCYMLTWQIRLSDRWATQKEVWYDRQTLLPRMVLLFDDNGRVVLRAYTSQPKAIEGYDPAVLMPSVYDMYFPDTGSTFLIKLKVLQREQNGAPNERSFAFPGGRSGVTHEKRIDG